ncbi:helix-turn-helix domain-containing protein [Halomonas sp. RT37]|uniref:Helix-turn-helix domain-containing protein n=1 Tax=Halomonas sp. RT37 TaxID=2950872 RepID=A0AAU7KGM1_9GAMM
MNPETPSTTISSAVPTFTLYGETGSWPTPDLLHCESIAERSRLHDWRIHPHRHVDLTHLLLLYAGEVELQLEDSRQRRAAPLLILVPALTIHGFAFAPNIQGHILTLAAPLVSHLEQVLPDASRVWRSAGVTALADARHRLQTLVEHIDGEYRRPARDRDVLLDALIQALTVEAARLATHPATRARSAVSTDPGHGHLARYQTLIERRFRQQPSIEEMARELDISAAHLNALCRRLADQSALAVLHQRLLLEAKRELTYTNLTIAQIADGLGFSEPAYFTRFFKRLSGVAPRDFRRRQFHRQGDGSPSSP